MPRLAAMITPLPRERCQSACDFAFGRQSAVPRRKVGNGVNGGLSAIDLRTAAVGRPDGFATGRPNGRLRAGIARRFRLAKHSLRRSPLPSPWVLAIDKDRDF